MQSVSQIDMTRLVPTPAILYVHLNTHFLGGCLKESVNGVESKVEEEEEMVVEMEEMEDKGEGEEEEEGTLR